MFRRLGFNIIFEISSAAMKSEWFSRLALKESSQEQRPTTNYSLNSIAGLVLALTADSETMWSTSRIATVETGLQWDHLVDGR